MTKTDEEVDPIDELQSDLEDVDDRLRQGNSLAAPVKNVILNDILSLQRRTILTFVDELDDLRDQLDELTEGTGNVIQPDLRARIDAVLTVGSAIALKFYQGTEDDQVKQAVREFDTLMSSLRDELDEVTVFDEVDEVEPPAPLVESSSPPREDETAPQTPKSKSGRMTAVRPNE